jgi:hypothetical protein
MAPLLRRAPLVRTTVEFYGHDSASVSLAPAPKRWPGHEGADRLVVPLGIAALALARAEGAVMASVRDRLRHAARAISDPDLAAETPSTLFVAVSGLRLAEKAEASEMRVVAQLVRSALGPVPTIGRASYGSLTLADAAAATLAFFLAPLGSDFRLAAALSLEGLLGWYSIADPHLQPPQQAIAYSLRHAVARLSEEDRNVPRDLTLATDEHRKISPMAGGA